MTTTTTHPTKTRLEPTEIAPETFIIHDHIGEGEAPVMIPINSLVIRAAEPVVVDTGFAANREQYLADVFSLVEPEDIRWVFISHDDVDHTGNVNELMAAAPNATLVINWFMQERMGQTLEVSPLRQRWLGDGEHFHVGDRALHAIRPPIFDSPTTRGLFDPTTGVYWSSDAFATPMLAPTADAADLDAEFWSDGMAMFSRYVSPWLTLVDDGKYQATVDRVAALGASHLVGCHTPAVHGGRVTRAIDITRMAPYAEITPEPDQTALEAIQQLMAETDGHAA